MNNRLTILLVTVALLFLISPAHAQTDPSLAGIQPQISVQVNAYKDQSNDAVQSAISSAVQPLNVYNPYGAAGQPVVVEFTLSNIGQEYPYNQIPLSPDVWALVMGVDKDLGVVLCKEKNGDGTCVNSDTFDVWSEMSGLQQVYYATGIGLSQVVETVSSEVSGKTCRYVDIYSGLPADVKKKIIAANDGKPPEAVYTWDCLDIVDEAFFNSRVKSYCKNQITTACITELNKEVGKQAVADTLPVILSSKVPKGQCLRPAFEQAKAGDILALLPQAATSPNVVWCGIGANGLLPNESVTFRFYVLIPADAPVVPVDELTNISQINEGVTTSPSCVNSDYPANCHSIYAAVVPVYPATLISDLAKMAGNVVTVAGGAFAFFWSSADTDAFANYILTQQNVAYGAPIWRGQGIFYVLGAQLQGDVYLYLFLAFVSSAGLNGAIKKKTGGGIQ